MEQSALAFLSASELASAIESKRFVQEVGPVLRD